MTRLLFASVLVSALAIPRGEAAPAPFPKKARNPSPPSSCVMVWDHLAWRAEFRADGSYRCSGYVGYWSIRGKTMWLVEWPDRENVHPADYDHYSIAIGEGRCGEFASQPSGRSYRRFRLLISE